MCTRVRGAGTVARFLIGARSATKSIAIAVLLATLAAPAGAQVPPWFPDLTQQQDYTPHLVSSTDPEGANFHLRVIPPGATLTVFDVKGRGEQ